MIWFQPSVICHYSTESGWNVVHRAYSDTLSGVPAGFYAGHPTIAEGRQGELVAVWEQFDSLNSEPNTDELRCRVLGARSVDGGATWGEAVVLAAGGTSTRRFPCTASRILRDTCHVLYLEDLEAGFAVASPPVGQMTPNPVIRQRFWKGELPSRVAITADHARIPERAMLNVRPSVFKTATTISYRLSPPTVLTTSEPRQKACLTIYDALGRPVRTFVTQQPSLGNRQCVTWDGRDKAGSLVEPGVYFCHLIPGNLSKKLMILP